MKFNLTPLFLLKIFIPLIILYTLSVSFFGFFVYFYSGKKKIEKIASVIYPYPIALVGQQIIFFSDFHKRMEMIFHYTFKTKTPLIEEKETKNQIFTQLIEQKIIEKRAKKEKIYPSRSEIEKATQDVIAKSGGEAQVKAVLSELYGIEKGDLKQLVKDQLVKEKIHSLLLVNLKVRHILIKDEGRAKDVLAQIKGGGNWDELTRKFSEDTNSREKGGDLGWVSYETQGLDKEFLDGAVKLDSGQISDLIKTNLGWEIIKVEEKKGKINLSFSEWLKEEKGKVRIFKLIKI